MKNRYPASEGWLRLTATLKSDRPLALQEMQLIACMGSPDLYDIAKCEQKGRTLRAIVREKAKASTAGQPLEA